MTQKRTSSFISRIAAISLFLALPATHLAAQNRPGKAQSRPGKVQGKTKAQTAVAEKDTIPFPILVMLICGVAGLLIF